MNSTKNDVGSLLASLSPILIAAQRIERMNPNSHHVALLNLCEIKGFQRLINGSGISELAWCGGSQNVQPARSNHPDTKGHVTGIDQIDLHQTTSLPGKILYASPLRFFLHESIISNERIGYQESLA